MRSENGSGEEGRPAGSDGVPPILWVPVSWGELLDKISILELKAVRIGDPARRANALRELRALSEVRDGAGALPADLPPLLQALADVNAELWEIEDALRAHEARGRFDAGFVALARQVYLTNDRRAALKRQINDLTGSALVEEKSYGAAGATTCRER